MKCHLPSYSVPVVPIACAAMITRAWATLEYQIPVAKDWALALFHDAGNAAQSWQSFKLEHANGIGVRWMSPIAPLSMDIAKAEKDGKLRWNMSLGLAF